MSPNHQPVLEVDPGSEVLFITKDCFSNQIRDEDDLFAAVEWEKVNPATGPLAVRGAAPGDTLVVDILSIDVGEQGAMVCVPGLGAAGHLITETETRIVPINAGHAVFNDKIKLPVKPMIGVIGTAPEREEIPCGTPGRHGGNMDTRQITAGTRLYLPVYVPGANLALGDLHAVMGDGEISVCGVEVPGQVKVKVNIIKDKQLEWPLLETEKDFHLITSAEDLDQAAEYAIQAALDFTLNHTDLELNGAISLLSIGAHLEISQVVDPLKTVRMRLPRRLFAADNYRF